MHIASPFDCSVAYQLGDGTKVQFWHDNWQEVPLRYAFPNLYQAALDKFSSVQQCMANNSSHLRFSLLSHAGLSQRDRLLILLQGVRNSQQQDNIMWLRHPTGFSVSSMYRFLSHTPSPTVVISNLWHVVAPLRVLIFAWLLINNRLTTIDNLVRRGWHMPNMCTMCKKDLETAHHLFQQCQIAAEICAYVYTTFAQQFSIPPKFTTIFSFELLTDPTEHMNARRIELVTCFILWRERCRRIFAQKVQTHISLVREIKMEFTAWFANMRK